MAARTVPTMPDWALNAEITSSLLNQITAYARFWANPPMFKFFQANVQSLPNGGPTTIVLDGTASWDTDSGHSGVSPFGYTIPAGMTGRWDLKWGGAFAGNATGVRDAELRINGNQPAVGGVGGYNQTASAGTCMVTGTTELVLNAGDVVTLVVNQTSGGALNTNVTGGQTCFVSGRLVSLASP